MTPSVLPALGLRTQNFAYILWQSRRLNLIAHPDKIRTTYRGLLLAQGLAQLPSTCRVGGSIPASYRVCVRSRHVTPVSHVLPLGMRVPSHMQVGELVFLNCLVVRGGLWARPMAFLSRVFPCPVLPGISSRFAVILQCISNLLNGWIKKKTRRCDARYPACNSSNKMQGFF